MGGRWWRVAGDEGGCWAGWGRGASRGQGWRVMAMTSVPAMQAVHALLAVQAKLAGMAVSVTHWWAGTGLGRMPEVAGGSAARTYFRRSQVLGCAQSGLLGSLGHQARIGCSPVQFRKGSELLTPGPRRLNGGVRGAFAAEEPP